MAEYLTEPVDRLPFGSPEKARRYATERYKGAIGLNWWSCDPTLQFLMRLHLGEEGLSWAEPHLERVGALMGGPIAERAEITDRNPPRLEKFDRWGRDVSKVIHPESFSESKSDLIRDSFTSRSFVERARQAGVEPAPLGAAWSYMLDQAEIGMACVLGTGLDMVVRMAERFAPDDVKARVAQLAADGSDLAGATAQMFTERTGGSDLAALETTATRAGDAWLLNGFKWFVSNVDGSAFVVLAKPEGGPDGTRGVAPFLALRERRDGSPNGVRVRQLKDKLGTKAVASAEVELIDAEAFLLAPTPGELTEESAGPHDGRGLGRMMELTNGARLGIAMMGLGVARRALVESLCYTAAREAFGHPLIEQPLMQRKLAELIVEVEAAQALVFDGYLGPRLRIAPPLIKLRAARLGITAASDAIEAHGGNGYIEQWPVARLLRDAQVNTVWEGPDNILCLDVRRAMDKNAAHEPFLDRIAAAIEHAPMSGSGVDQPTVDLVAQRAAHLRRAIEAWQRLDGAVAEARLFPLARYMVDVYAAALLLEQAGAESRLSSGAGSPFGSGRKGLIARLYARDHLADPGPLRGIDSPAEEFERFKELCDGTLIDRR
ncbi:MAG TPA: acyl-CoA dehydrogenase family protein [Acidimicrobiales bacterium]|nr:acyl-CoA dehydrogenase family protein [Acidimicrobiales bacterium]